MHEYLGDVDLEGKRVLEVGPASGFATAHMETMGAEVVAVELPEDYPWDIVPYAQLDLEQIAADRLWGMRALRNGFLYAHRALGLRARLFYGSVADLSGDHVPFDVSVLAVVLLHTRDPVALLEACAARTRESIVVVERSFPELNRIGMPLSRLEPTVENEMWHTWWSFTPSWLQQLLAVLGFDKATVSFHEQRHRSGMIPLFTVVASK